MQIVPDNDQQEEKILKLLSKFIAKGEHFSLFQEKHAKYLKRRGIPYVRDRFGPIYLVAKNNRAFKVDDDFMRRAGYARKYSMNRWFAEMYRELSFFRCQGEQIRSLANK